MTLGRIIDIAVHHQFSVGPDAGQRRLQFVTDRRHKLRLLVSLPHLRVDVFQHGRHSSHATFVVVQIANAGAINGGLTVQLELQVANTLFRCDGSRTCGSHESLQSRDLLPSQRRKLRGISHHEGHQRRGAGVVIDQRFIGIEDERGLFQLLERLFESPHKIAQQMRLRFRASPLIGRPACFRRHTPNLMSTRVNQAVKQAVKQVVKQALSRQVDLQ